MIFHFNALLEKTQLKERASPKEEGRRYYSGNLTLCFREHKKFTWEGEKAIFHTVEGIAQLTGCILGRVSSSQ